MEEGIGREKPMRINEGNARQMIGMIISAGRRSVYRLREEEPREYLIA